MHALHGVDLRMLYGQIAPLSLVLEATVGSIQAPVAQAS